MRLLWPHNFSQRPGQIGGGWLGTKASEFALQAQGLHPRLLQLGNLRNPLGTIRARRLVSFASEQADVIHVQFGSACALICAKASDRPRVVTLRGSDWYAATEGSWLGRVHSRSATVFTRWALPSYSAVICVSHRMASEVKALLPSANTHVLPSPIDLQRFGGIDRASARRRLGLRDLGERYVLYGAAKSGLQHNKRLWLAQQAIEWAMKRMPNLRPLTVVGVPRESIPDFFAAADVALCTSIKEGWPNFVKEALASNVPFVSTDVSDLSRIAAAEPSCRVVGATPEEIGSAICEVLAMDPPSNLHRYLAGMTMHAHADALLRIYAAAARTAMH
jgi:teichuronic acid biosynthesis glycosyltransferase TuaC